MSQDSQLQACPPSKWCYLFFAAGYLSRYGKRGPGYEPSGAPDWQLVVRPHTVRPRSLVLLLQQRDQAGGGGFGIAASCFSACFNCFNLQIAQCKKRHDVWAGLIEKDKLHMFKLKPARQQACIRQQHSGSFKYQPVDVLLCHR
eukprot:1137879-Pelagomonas_calceolata.AAC.6